jgi:hypothetical protein
MHYTTILVKAWQLSTASVTVRTGTPNALFVANGTAAERSAIAAQIVALFANYGVGATIGAETQGTCPLTGKPETRLVVHLPQVSATDKAASARFAPHSIAADARLS